MELWELNEGQTFVLMGEDLEFKILRLEVDFASRVQNVIVLRLDNCEVLDMPTKTLVEYRGDWVKC